ncbi:hypothetical protein GCM10010106_17840 [Thermopolyspora flexuosa]|nr:hypothetical protein GCM10010106_17840 [Thermopolyspora flexuosa]
MLVGFEAQHTGEAGERFLGDQIDGGERIRVIDEFAVDGEGLCELRL